jgi:hypothetical protein
MNVATSLKVIDAKMELFLGKTIENVKMEISKDSAVTAFKSLAETLKQELENKPSIELK